MSYGCLTNGEVTWSEGAWSGSEETGRQAPNHRTGIAVSMSRSDGSSGLPRSSEQEGTLQPELDLTATVSSHFERIVAANPGAPAVVHPSGKVLTYGEVHERALQTATAILRSPVERNEPIAVSAEDTGDAIIGMMAALASGRPFVAIDRSDPPARLARILHDSTARTLVVNSENSTIEMRLAGLEQDVIDIGAVDSSPPGPDPLPLGSLSDISHILYTSGSTGLPKGVVHNHRNLLHKGVLAHDLFGIASSDRVSLLFSPATGAGLSGIFGALLNGAAVCPYNSVQAQHAAHSGGRCWAQGRASSRAAAACRTPRSSSRRPTSCSPTGRPAAVKPAGTLAAGLWLMLNG